MDKSKRTDPSGTIPSGSLSFSMAESGQRLAHGRRAELHSRKKRVLLVDDNLDGAVMISLILRKQGHEVVTADNGADGLGWGKLLRPEVVILDLNMPGMDGFETCRRMRREEWGADVRLVALTGLAGEEDRERSKEAGFDLHIVKPIDGETLARVINDPGPEEPGSGRPL